MKIDTCTRRALFSELKSYCHHAEQGDYMEVTEWNNDEGCDITIHRARSNERFSLTHSELDLLTIMMKWRGE